MASLKGVGQDLDRVMAFAAGDEGQVSLQRETEEARSLGVFGSPTLRVGDQLFWGDDRLEDAVDWAPYGCARRRSRTPTATASQLS